jgi:hypothetical protein
VSQKVKEAPNPDAALAIMSVRKVMPTAGTWAANPAIAPASITAAATDRPIPDLA